MYEIRPKDPAPAFDSLTYCVALRLLYGRPGPTKAPWNLSHLRAGGIRAVLSLITLSDPAQVRKAGLVHYCSPVAEYFQDFRQAAANWRAIFERFDQIISFHALRREAVLVHCNSGKNRTGLVMGYFLATRRGLSARKALANLRRLKPKAVSKRGYEELFFAMERYFEERRAFLRREGCL